MDHDSIIVATKSFVQEQLTNAETGHDYWHALRVWEMVKRINQEEHADSIIVEVAALLHDVADSKFHDESKHQVVTQFLQSLPLPAETITQIELIIKHLSFKGGNITQTWTSPELKIVQDADRLDAIGAIGIARTFNYGGFKGRPLYNPTIKPNLQQTPEQYHSSTAPTINHFYEKLLLLKDRMNTKTGKKIAEQRHLFMEQFLEEFYAEWDGKR